MDIVLVDWSPTASPKRYGLKWQSYSVPVPFLDDAKLIQKYKDKHEDVQNALKNGVSKFCYEEDDWKEFGQPGNRCNLYCESKDACQKYFKREHNRTNKYLL